MRSAYNYRYSCVVGGILDMFLQDGIIKDDNWRLSLGFCSSCRFLYIKYIFYHLIDWF